MKTAILVVLAVIVAFFVFPMAVVSCGLRSSNPAWCRIIGHNRHYASFELDGRWYVRGDCPRCHTVTVEPPPPSTWRP